MARAKKKTPTAQDFGLAVLHNQLARCNSDLSTTAFRLILLMADHVRQDGELTPFTLRVADYRQRLNLRGEPAYGHLEAVVLRLMKTIVRTPKPVGGESLFQVLAPTEIEPGGEFVLKFNEGMRPLLLSLKELFCKIPLDVFFRIQGAYAVRFYLFCKSWDPEKHHEPGWRMTVKELREWMGFEAGEYEKSFHIRAAVIERAKKELDMVADVSFEYDPISAGGRTVGWSFIPVVNRPKSQKLDRRRKSPPALPPPQEQPPPEPDYGPMAQLWTEASEEQRKAWLEDDFLRMTAPKGDEKPRRTFLARLFSLTQPKEAAPATTVLVSPQQPEDVAA
jgi:Initiator Replication protein